MTDNSKSLNSPPPPPRTVSGTVVHQRFSNDSNEAAFMNLIRRNDILMEFKNLINLKCKNIYIYQSKDIYKWLGVIFIHEGYYRGGVFKFNVIFSESQHANPVIQFTTHIYHPLVNKHGYFNPVYNQNIDIKCSVIKLLYVLNDALSNKETFKEFDNEKICNHHAWDSYNTDHEFFEKLVKDCVDNSISDDILYENCDTESIKFQKINEEQFIKNKNKILDIYKEVSYLDDKVGIDGIVYRFKCAIEKRSKRR